MINGVPVVQIELKTLGISPRRAMEQIVEYKNDPGNGYTKTILCFLQLFIVSNRDRTFYFANNNARHFAFNAEERFLPAYEFADVDNKKVVHLDSFAETFLVKCTLGQTISRYMVLVASEQKLLMMRPYQVYAVKAIVDSIAQDCGNGYVWHFIHRQARQANKIVPCKWAGTPNKGSGLRAADGTISEYLHAGLPVQDFRIPDNVLRLTRHKGRGIETEHPAVFPVVLPEFLMRTYTDDGEVVFEPFGGSGTTILAGQRTGRAVRAIELAPAYVDLAVARWRMLHPDLPVTLADDGRDYDAVAAARMEVTANAA